MTEEQIETQAEIYAKEKHCKECINIPICWENDIEDCCTDCIKTSADFIAGAKWGMEHAIEWHDIESHILPKREISKKYMPKANEKVMLKYHFYNETEIHYSDGYYDMFDFEFHIPNNPTGRIICVIAWCELPKFKENNK